MAAKRLRIAMFSTMINGGAGYAALRVHDALRLSGAGSTLYVGQAERGRHPGIRRLRDAEEGCQPRRVPGLTIFSVDPPGIPDAELDEIIAQADIFNLHWFARFLSVRNVERLSSSGKPVIITVRDMNPLTGGCHFFHGCENWKRDCFPCPQFIPDTLPLPGATLDAKRTLWNLENITVVVLSDHTASLIECSPLFGQCRIEKIPNPMDVSIFKPHRREAARAALGIPQDKHAVAYLPSFGSSVKGGSQAVAALERLARDVPAKDCVVVCAGDLEKPLQVPFETIEVGFIADKHRLAQFYSAADVTLIPSTEETFSNTAAESVACGTPVVGFRVGAIPEIAQGARGRAVAVNDIEALAGGLRTMLSRSQDRPEELHRYVAETFAASAIGPRYLALFEELHGTAQTQTVSAQVERQNAPAVHRFDQLLADYRVVRSEELRKDRDARRRETRGLRGRLRLMLRGIRLFFADNEDFRRQLRSLLEGRR
jgi:glycosyltransferase involved in cell wall biosynthesis